jgi:DNA-directed RNA polymerase subunit RPC12/RpoP
MIYCSNCGEKNSDTAIFCNKCGQKLILPEQKTCSTCGSEIEPGMIFCPSCGKQIDSKPEENQNNSLKVDSTSPNSDNAILEFIWIGWREKGKIMAQRGAMIFYREFLIMAKGGSIEGFRLGEMAGVAVIPIPGVGSKIGKNIEKDIVEKKKTEQASKTPKELLKADPDNFMLKYGDISSIKMSYSTFKGGGKIEINTNSEVYEYYIQDYKNYEKYVKSLQSIFGNKLKD